MVWGAPQRPCKLATHAHWQHIRLFCISSVPLIVALAPFAHCALEHLCCLFGRLLLLLLLLLLL